MAKVFISYRRDDAKWQAREVYRALTRVLPRDHVFMDIDSIPPGADFVDILEGWVDQCDVLLALIGAGWIDAVDPKTNRRRLENPEDFVRIEVRKALARGIPVVPVLLDGAQIPDVDRLPDDLKRLTRRNAEFIEHRTVDTDVERLIRKLGLSQEGSQPVRPQTASPTAVYHYSPEGRIKVEARLVHGVAEETGGGWFKPGAGKTEWFKDLDAGPEMLVVPSGSFMMGSPENEPAREAFLKGSESPLHKVTIARPYAVGRHATTRGQFAAFVNNTGYKTEGGAYVRNGDNFEHDPKASWRSPGFSQDDSHPVVCINWDDANAYAAWLSDKTGNAYRLLTEAEREHVARAGTTTPFWWGTSITPAQANYNGNYTYAGGGSFGDWRKGTVPVDSFAANPWGLFNVHGNVFEWCADIWHDNYNGAPTDGTAWLQGGDTNRRAVCGGSWADSPSSLRAAYRFRLKSHVRVSEQGFRLARTLNP